MEKAKKASTASAKSATAGNPPKTYGIGRRKSAVARVWLRRGTGSIVVNGKDYKDYFDTEMNRIDASILMQLIPAALKYDFEANVAGGGSCGQAGAVKLGIARALVANEEELRPLLREHDLLTVDARRKERKKYGQKGARRKFQFVKR